MENNINSINKKLNKITAKSTFKCSVSDLNIASQDGSISLNLIPLKKKEILNMRLNHRKTFFIFKKDGNFFTIPETLLGTIGNIYVDGKAHLCLDCKNFFKCPKVLDRDLFARKTYMGTITKLRYEESKRIEKYDFITLGYETFEHFYVWKCKNFCNPDYDVDKAIKLEKKYSKKEYEEEESIDTETEKLEDIIDKIS